MNKRPSIASMSPKYYLMFIFSLGNVKVSDIIYILEIEKRCGTWLSAPYQMI